VTGFLDSYGAGEERREKIVKRLVLGALAALVVAAALYFVFRNWGEDRQARLFLDLLKKQDYQSAYRLWGCTPATPCRDYRFERFMEDWGPQSPHGNTAAARIAKKWSCADGVIYTLEYGKDDSLLLWVGREDKVLGYAPWPSCNPRMPAPGP
jgi:hypothetical protein